MRNIIIFCFFVICASPASAQSRDEIPNSQGVSEPSIIPENRVFESAKIELVSEPSEFSDGRIKLLDLNKYDNPNCRTCWVTMDLSRSYWLQIAGIKSAAKLSDVLNHKQPVVTVFITKSNKVGRISYDEALLTEEYYSLLEN